MKKRKTKRPIFVLPKVRTKSTRKDHQKNRKLLGQA